MEYLSEDILQNARDRQAFCPLGSPRGVDFTGMPAPEVFGVVLEEHRVELPPEAVDVKILKVVFRQLVQHGAEIAEAAFHGRFEAHVSEGLRLQGDRIGIELPVEENAGHSAPFQHDDVGFLRVRPAGCKLCRPPENNVVVGGGALHRHHLLPPVVHFRHFGEKPVPAHIHAVPAVFHGSGDAPEDAGFLQHGDVRFFLSGEQLIRCREPGRPSSDDDNFLHPISSPVVCVVESEIR